MAGPVSLRFPLDADGEGPFSLFCAFHRSRPASTFPERVEAADPEVEAAAGGVGVILPSLPLVDNGRHTFILYTAEYAEFCDRVAGRFIHHAPADGEGPGTPLSAALDAMHGQGFHVGGELWGLDRGECTTNGCRSSGCTAKALRSDCTQCHAGCHDFPKRS